MTGKDKKIVKKKMIKTLKDTTMSRVARPNHAKSKAATKKIKTSLKKVDHSFDSIIVNNKYFL